MSRPWQILTSAICIAGGIFIYTKSAGDFSPALGLVRANVSRADVMHHSLRLSMPFNKNSFQNANLHKVRTGTRI